MKIYNQTSIDRLPAGILFDTDNTLYDYAPAHHAALEAVCKKSVSQLSLTEDEFFETYTKARTQIKNQLGRTASSHSRLLYLQRMMELAGLGSQVLLALELEQTYWRTFLRKAILFDDVIEFLDDLRLLAIPMVIVTDLTAQVQFRKIVYFGLDRFFDFVVTSEEVGEDKPAADAFKLALEKMRNPRGSIWMIGDNPVNDIQGARRHINAVTFQKLHKGVAVGDGDQMPDVSFTRYGDLRRLLNRLSSEQPDER